MTQTGTLVGFSGEVRVGSTTVASRSAAAGETRLTGETDFSIYGTDQLWDSKTWGTALSLLNTAGTAAEDTSQAVSVSFRGQMEGATSESVSLRNFTVIRYPAQVNP